VKSVISYNLQSPKHGKSIDDYVNSIACDDGIREGSKPNPLSQNSLGPERSIQAGFEGS
jgi:hypothetical protein